MSRPQPTHICSHIEGAWHIEVCAADAVYAVVYNGEPIKLRKVNPAVKYQGIKYMKSTFPEPGHAIRMARRLNAAHGTDAFTVVQMTTGRTINLEKTPDL